MKRQPTIKDVARLAEVSIATVSRVVNQSGFVSEELAKRVLSTMQELHYFPNRFARSLKKQNSFAVAYLVPDIDNPIFAKVARGIQDVMEEAGFDVFLHNTHFSDTKLFHHLMNLLENHPQGIILSAWHSEKVKEAVVMVQRLRIPLVVVHSPRDIPEVDAVLVNDEKGAYEAVRFLVSLGHRAIISLGVAKSTTSALRKKGYVRALFDSNEIPKERYMFEVESFFSKNGYEIVCKAQDEGLTFSAIFAHSDTLAIGALEALAERGLRVPEEVSVMGFDGAYASFVLPRLTTMLIPNYDMGKVAAELLLARIEGDTSPPAVQLFAPHLIVQRSTAPCKESLG